MHKVVGYSAAVRRVGASLGLPSLLRQQPLIPLEVHGASPFLWPHLPTSSPIPPHFQVLQSLSLILPTICLLISFLICDFRVLPHRRSQPKAYRLYLELLSRYALSFNPVMADACKEK